MTPIQEKAIRHAIALLEEISTREFWPGNHDSIASAEAAAVKQRAEVRADSAKKMEAIEWLKATLG